MFVTRYRYFEYSKNNKNTSQEVIAGFNEYDLQDWLTDENVYLGSMETYGNNFLVKISDKIGSTLTRKEQQTILRKICSDWKSFFGSLKSEKANNPKVNIPYFKQDEYATSEFNIQMTLFSDWNKNHSIGVTGTKARIKMPLWLKRDKIQSTRLKYKNGNVYLEVIYNKDEQKIKQRLLKKRTAAIDPGLNEFVTITFNWMKKPIAISGKHLKSVNQLYNKNRAKLNSVIDKSSNEIEIKKLIELRNKVTEKRNKRIEHELHVISNYIVKILVENRISKLVFGHNNGQKDKINIGTKNNQNFVTLPFAKLINLLEYKCEEQGIELIIQEESYTSKASFLSNDFIPIKNNEPEDFSFQFSGYRSKRGQYKDNQYNIIIHSDCNGSYNIMRKEGSTIHSLNKLRKEMLNKNKIIEPFGVRLALN